MARRGGLWSDLYKTPKTKAQRKAYGFGTLGTIDRKKGKSLKQIYDQGNLLNNEISNTLWRNIRTNELTPERETQLKRRQAVISGLMDRATEAVREKQTQKDPSLFRKDNRAINTDKVYKPSVYASKTLYNQSRARYGISPTSFPNSGMRDRAVAADKFSAMLGNKTLRTSKFDNMRSVSMSILGNANG